MHNHTDQQVTLRIAMIAAIGAGNRVIGFNNGEMPWPKISEDLKHFKRTTLGCPIIMGRKTFESFGARPLPERTNIVITRQRDYEAPDTVVVLHNLEDALYEASVEDPKKVFIIGGGEIYQIGMSFADELFITEVKNKKSGNGEFDGEVFFPKIPDCFKKISSNKGEGTDFAEVTFQHLEKK